MIELLPTRKLPMFIYISQRACSVEQLQCTLHRINNSTTSSKCIFEEILYKLLLYFLLSYYCFIPLWVEPKLIVTIAVSLYNR